MCPAPLYLIQDVCDDLEQLAVEVREPRIRISAAAKLSPEQRRPKLNAPEAELDALDEALAGAIG